MPDRNTKKLFGAPVGGDRQNYRTEYSLITLSTRIRCASKCSGHTLFTFIKDLTQLLLVADRRDTCSLWRQSSAVTSSRETNVFHGCRIYEQVDHDRP